MQDADLDYYPSELGESSEGAEDEDEGTLLPTSPSPPRRRGVEGNCPPDSHRRGHRWPVSKGTDALRQRVKRGGSGRLAAQITSLHPQASRGGRTYTRNPRFD